MEIPVYLFTGFLESGKTHFIKETLADPNFFEGHTDRTLVILTEEGEEEIYPAELASKEIYLEIIDDEKGSIRTSSRHSGANTARLACLSNTTA